MKTKSLPMNLSWCLWMRRTSKWVCVTMCRHRRRLGMGQMSADLSSQIHVRPLEAIGRVGHGFVVFEFQLANQLFRLLLLDFHG